ncbi:MAG: UvrD-helicase domain-containing protein [Bilophila wadsworthia]
MFGSPFGGSLTWVGDVKQAIYGWRGGDATLFDEVRSDAELCAVAPEPRVDILPTNWRSCRAIVETNNTLFRQLSETATAKAVLSAMLPKDTPSALLATILEEGAQLLKEGFAGSEQKVAPDKAEGFLRLQRVYGDKSEDLDEEVRERLLGCVQEVVSRRPWGDVTVLVRSNGKAAQVAGWLMEEGIPVVTDNSFLLAEHPLVEQITALLTFLDSPRNDLAFWTFLSGRQMLLPLIPLSEQALEDWAAARRTSERRNMPLFMAFREDFPDIWRKWIAPFHADAGLLTPYDVTREALGRLDIWSRYPDEAAFVRRFLEIIHVAEGQGYGSLSSFLDYWNKHGQQEKAPMPETLDAVRVMTMHKSKGLQFPVVIVPWHNFSQRVDSPAVETHVTADGACPRGPASGTHTTRPLRTTPVKRCTCFMWRGRGRKRSCTPS